MADSVKTHSGTYQQDSSDGTFVPQKSSNNAGYAYETGVIAGERNSDSASNSYIVTRDESNMAIIHQVAAVTIGAGSSNDTQLRGLQISTALTGTCAITGFVDTDGSAYTYTLPAATPAGFKEFAWAKNAAGALTITVATTADSGAVAVFWRPA